MKIKHSNAGSPPPHPPLFATYLWCFLRVASFPFTPYGFSLTGGQNGLWQRLSFIFYNLVKKRRVGRRRRVLFLKARSKNSRDWLELNNQLSWTSELWPVEGVISQRPSPRARTVSTEGAYFCRRGSTVAWAATPRAVSYP